MWDGCIAHQSWDESSLQRRGEKWEKRPVLGRDDRHLMGVIPGHIE